LFRLMQAVGDQGMGVFVEHGVSFVRLLPGGGGGFPAQGARPVVAGLGSPPPAQIIYLKKNTPGGFFFL
ncbi:hypothetical protein ACVGX5_00410, partial [Enterobacter intestinihominis]